MKAEKFIKKVRALCHSYVNDAGCAKCPLCVEKQSRACGMLNMKPRALVKAVKAWDKGNPQPVQQPIEHPVKTRLMDLLEKYPGVEMDATGCPLVCAKALGYCTECEYPEDICTRCWDVPV